MLQSSCGYACYRSRRKVVQDQDIFQRYAWDTETGYIWVGDNRDGGLTRIDYLISGDMTGKQNFIENLIAQSYVQKTSKEEEKHE